MTPRSEQPYELEVSRADLAQALKPVARAIGKLPGDASLRFEDGNLSVEAANTTAEAPARGAWPVPVFAGHSWVQQIANRMLAGDPIRLRVAEGRIYANRYSEPCALAPREYPPDPGPPQVDKQQLILEAARILKRLLITISDLEKLVSEAVPKETVSWSAEEKKMMRLVTKAWLLLASLGVEIADIRRLIDKAVRNAWK
jgi:hypothetical protein